MDTKKVKKYIESEIKKNKKEKRKYQNSNLECPFIEGKIFSLEELSGEIESETAQKKPISVSTIKIFMISKVEEILNQRKLPTSGNQRQFLYGQQDVYEKFNNEIEKGNFNNNRKGA